MTIIANALGALMGNREGMIYADWFPERSTVADGTLTAIVISRLIWNMASLTICGLGNSVIECCRKPARCDVTCRTLTWIMIFWTVILVAKGTILHVWPSMIKLDLIPVRVVMAEDAVGSKLVLVRFVLLMVGNTFWI